MRGKHQPELILMGEQASLKRSTLEKHTKNPP